MGGLHFSEDRLFSADGGGFSCSFRFFKKMPSWRSFCAFLRLGKIYFYSRLWRLGSWQCTPRGRRTRNTSKQEVLERFGVFVPLQLALDVGPPWFCTIFLRIIFAGLTNLFCFVCFFVPILTKLGLDGKKGLGAAELRSFWEWHFSHFSGRGPICDIFGARLCHILGWSRAHSQEWPCGCSAEGFLWIFHGCSFDTVFAWFKDDLLKLPSSSFRVLLFSAFSSWVWGQRNPARVFRGSWP